MRFLYTVNKDLTVDKKYIKVLPSEAVDYGGLSLMIFEFLAKFGSYNRDCTWDFCGLKDLRVLPFELCFMFLW